MKLVELEPGDVLVVRLDQTPEPEQVQAIRDACQTLRPGEQVIVLPPGVEIEALSAQEFVVDDVFEISGRGPVITRSQGAARDAWARGERWVNGQTIVSGDDRQATIIGVERFRVPEGHPAHNDAALLLRGVTVDDLHQGQIWRLSAEAVLA